MCLEFTIVFELLIFKCGFSRVNGLCGENGGIFKKYYLTLQRLKNSGQNSMNMDKEKLIHSIRVQENSSFKGIDLQIGCNGKRIVTWDDNRLDIWDSDNMQNLLSVASVIKPVLNPERKRLLSATEEGNSIC